MATYTGTITYELDDGSTTEVRYIGESDEINIDVDISRFIWKYAPADAVRYDYEVAATISWD